MDLVVVLVAILSVLISLSGQVTIKSSEIAFISNRDGRFELHLLDTQHRLTIPIPINDPSLQPTDFDWSPDGTQIVFSARPRSNQEIFLLDVHSGEVENITNYLEADDLSPTWSPDGTQIAFVSRRGSTVEIYIMEIATRQLSRLTEDQFFNQLPDWSSDRELIAFSSFRNTQGQGLFSYNFRTQIVTPLTSGQYVDFYPTWSPDRQTMIFSSLRSGIMSLYLLDVASGTIEPLTANAPASYPDWSLDGRQVLFAMMDQGSFDIFSMNTDRTNLRRLTFGVSDDTNPAMRPLNAN